MVYFYMRIFERPYLFIYLYIFWLVLKLEISYRVMISWRILVSFGLEEFFEDYIFCMVKCLSFHNSCFCLQILFNVNGKATVWHTPLFIYFDTPSFYVGRSEPAHYLQWFFFVFKGSQSGDYHPLGWFSQIWPPAKYEIKKT